MQISPRLLVRAGVVAGLTLSAMPTLRTVWTPIQHAGASPTAGHVEVRGFSQALLAQAAARPVPMILLLRPGASSSADGVMQSLRAHGATNVASLGLVNGISANVNRQTLASLRYDTRLLEVQPDQVLQPMPIPNLATLQAQVAHANMKQQVQVPPGQPVISEPDTLGIIHADAAQKIYSGRDVRVAVIDSGIDLSHPDLQGVMLKGADGKPLYKDFTNTDLTDTIGHGTACAGTIAAQGKTVYSASDTYQNRVYPPPKPGQRFNDHTYFTFTGVAPGVKLMAAKIFDSRANTSTSDWVRAIQWAVQNHADIISESWGYPALFYSGSDVIALADEQAVQHGVTVVVSNGNAGPGAASSGMPANLPDVISVGASTDYRQYAETGLYARYGAFGSDNIAAFSSRGPTPDGRARPDLYAPGEGSWATFPHTRSADGPTTPPYTIGAFSGTSMAAPVTAAVVAMTINAYRETHGGKSPTPAFLKQVLTSSADDLGYSAQDQGAGRVNALRAVQTVTHKGPSVLLSAAGTLSGLPGQTVSQPITITNSGSTPERITMDPQVLRQTKTLGFGGTAVADNQVPYHFMVPKGTNQLTAAINFDSQRNVPLPGQTAQNVVMQVVLYDPNGNMVNVEQSSLPEASFTTFAVSGFASTTAAHPAPGLWTAVVSQAPRRDKHDVRHYINMPFKGRITLAAFQKHGGLVSPASVTLRPGATTHMVFHPDPLVNPGVTTITLHVHARNMAPVPAGSTSSTSTATDATAMTAAPVETTATIPVVLTTDIAIRRGVGSFSGVFTGGVGTQGFGREYRYYTFKVPADANNVQVSVRWLHRANLFLLGLIDPNGKIVNVVDNSLRNADGTPDLTHPSAETFLNHPIPGTWRIAFMTLITAGVYPNEPFQGIVVINQQPAQLSSASVSTHAGGSPAAFTVKVKNTGVGIDAYYSYTTTDQYAYLALGGTGGTLQNGTALGVGATQTLTYTTSFVPPGTREVISQAQGLNNVSPIDVELDDSQFASYRAFAQQSQVALSGQVGNGYSAVIRGKSLPIGQYFVQVSLPTGKSTKQVYVAASTQAYALSPQPWIKMDAQRAVDGTLNQSLLVALPTGSVTFHGRVSVPSTVAPGTYHAHIFIYNFRDDQVADLPLTVNVLPAGPEPAATPDPLLATIASTQYFPEGATASGLLDQMDLVNPGSSLAHVQVRLLTEGGWTTVTRYALPAHSRKSVNVQPLVGIDQAIAAIVQADQTVVSGRLILRQGEAGSYSVGTVAPGKTWYFADGYTVGNFQEFLTIVNPGAQVAHLHIHLVSDQGGSQDGNLTVNGSSRRTIQVADLMPGKAVSASITSDVPVVAERLQEFGNLGQGVTTTIGATAASKALYIDPGHLPKGTQGHITVYNPGSTPATVTLAMINGNGKTMRTLKVQIMARHRTNVDLTARYGTAGLGALITSDAPVVAEKVAYFGKVRKGTVGGSDLAGQATPTSHVVFPGGTTANGAVDYLNLYNPGAVDASIVVTAVYDGNHTLQRTVQIPAQQRKSIDVSSLGLPSGASSLIVDGSGGAQFYATQSTFNKAGTDGSEISGIVTAGQ